MLIVIGCEMRNRPSAIVLRCGDCGLPVLQRTVNGGRGTRRWRPRRPSWPPAGVVDRSSHWRVLWCNTAFNESEDLDARQVHGPPSGTGVTGGGRLAGGNGGRPAGARRGKGDFEFELLVIAGPVWPTFKVHTQRHCGD